MDRIKMVAADITRADNGGYRLVGQGGRVFPLRDEIERAGFLPGDEVVIVSKADYERLTQSAP